MKVGFANTGLALTPARHMNLLFRSTAPAKKNQLENQKFKQ